MIILYYNTNMSKVTDTRVSRMPDKSCEVRFEAKNTIRYLSFFFPICFSIHFIDAHFSNMIVAVAVAFRILQCFFFFRK